MKKLGLCSLLLALMVSSSYGQDLVSQIDEVITQEKIQSHIYFLADDLLKGRKTGTPENKIAANYLANQLRANGALPAPGMDSYLQIVPMEVVNAPKRINLAINGNNVKAKIPMESGKVDQSTDAIYLGFGTADDFKGKDLRKKIVVVKGGTADGEGVRQAFGERGAKSKRAKEAGALAVIELVKSDEGTWNYLQDHFGGSSNQLASKDEGAMTMPYMWVKDEYGTYILEMEQGKTKVSLTATSARKTPFISQNVVAYIPGTDPVLKDEYIIYSGHYDHVGVDESIEGDNIFNGARDNAVGVTTVLSMAEQLGKHPTKRSALFILFTAEEEGLLGSQYYTNNPMLPLEQMVFCFNSDNGGYNDTTLATIIGLDRTTAAENIKTAAKAFGLTAIEDPAPEQGLFDRSDNVHFAKKGVPAPTFSMGFTAFDEEIAKYYHQPSDHADSIDYAYLEKFFQAYVYSGVLIGNDPQKPVWVAGDKYEEAGKALYGQK